MAGWLPAWKTPVNFASSSNKEQAKESLPAALPRAVTSLQPCPGSQLPSCTAQLCTRTQCSLPREEKVWWWTCAETQSISNTFFFFFLKEISQFCYLKPLLDKYFSDSPLSPLKAFLYRKQFLFSSQPKRTRSSQRFDWIWQWKYCLCSSNLAVKPENHSPEIKITWRGGSFASQVISKWSKLPRFVNYKNLLCKRVIFIDPAQKKKTAWFHLYFLWGATWSQPNGSPKLCHADLNHSILSGIMTLWNSRLRPRTLHTFLQTF